MQSPLDRINALAAEASAINNQFEAIARKNRQIAEKQLPQLRKEVEQHIADQEVLDRLCAE